MHISKYVTNTYSVSGVHPLYKSGTHWYLKYHPENQSVVFVCLFQQVSEHQKAFGQTRHTFNTIHGTTQDTKEKINSIQRLRVDTEQIKRTQFKNKRSNKSFAGL